MYKMIFDYHTHTTYSDGKGSIEDNVIVAVGKGLKGLAISEHGPGHWTYGVKRKDLPLIKEEIERLKPLYPEIELYFSVEANIINTGNFLDIQEEEKELFDFIHAGYHYGLPRGYSAQNYVYSKVAKMGREKLREKNTLMTLGAIENNKLKILTHPGDKGPFDIAEISKACARHQVWMEINMRHTHLTTEEIKIAMKEDVLFVLSSDAHKPERVGTFLEGVERAKAAGLDLDRIVNLEIC